MTIVFATNDPTDFPGVGVSTNTIHFRSAYVGQAMTITGKGEPILVGGMVIPTVAGDITWIHFQYAKDVDFSHVNADGGAVFELRASDGSVIMDFDLLAGTLRGRLFGSSTLTVDITDNLTGTAVKAIDVMIDLTSDITVEIYVAGVLKYDESQAWSSSPGNPTFISWRIFDATAGTSIEGRQWVSEVIIADENTVGMGLSEMTPDAAGNYSEWQGDHVETGDSDLGTGASVDATAQKLSSGLSTFGGPSSSALRAIVVKSKASTRGGTVNDMRHFLRINSTDYDGSALGIGEGIGTHIEVYDTNPDTAGDWDTDDFTGVEVGIESLA